MIAVSIEIRDKRFLNKFGKLERNKPGRRICRRLAQEIVMQMKSRAPYWYGTLQASIQSRETSHGYRIYADTEAVWIEYGTAPHWVPNQSMLRLWAMDKGWNWYALKHLIHEKGTQPHPFVQPSIDTVMADFDNIGSSEVETVFEEAGFRR